MTRFLIVLAMAVIIPLLLIVPQGQSQSAARLKSQDEQMRDFAVNVFEQGVAQVAKLHDTYKVLGQEHLGNLNTIRAQAMAMFVEEWEEERGETRRVQHDWSGSYEIGEWP